MTSQPPAILQINEAWKILIIDDDEDDYLIARDMLKAARGRKFDIHWVNTYAAGREKLISDHYHAVLVDYDLGIHSGIELIREASKRGYSAPLILFTGRGSYEVDVEAMEAGATLYLSKGEATPLLLERAIRYAIELKQKELALRMTEAKERAKVAELNAIMDAVPAIVWITHDPQAKEVTGNQAAHDFLRVPAGKNLSKSALGDAPRNFQVYQEGRELAPEELPLQITAATGQPIWNFEEEVVFEDGDRAYLLGNVTPLLDEDGKPGGAVGAFINITERKQAENDLAQKEADLTEAQRIAHIGSWYWDAETDITTGSDELSHIYGLDPATQPMLAFGEQKGRFYPPETWERLNEAVQRTVKTGVGYELDLEAFNNGNPIWVTSRSEAVRDANGRIVGLRGTVQDITERKQAEELVQQSLALAEEGRRTLEALMEYIPEGITIADGSDATIRMVSRYGQEILGSAHDQKTAEQVADEWKVYDRDGVTPLPPEELPLVRAIQRGEVVKDQELVQVNSNGQHLYLSCNAGPIRDASGNITGGVVAWRDILERKQAEQALRQAHQKAIWLARFPDENPNPVTRVSADGVILYRNTTSANLPGWNDEVGQRLTGPLMRMVDQAMTHGLVVREDVPFSDRYYSITIMPILEENYANIYGTDITERRISEERYQRLFRSIDEGFCIIEVLFDDRQTPVDYRFLETNPAFERLTGIQDAEGRQMREIAPQHEDYWFEIYGEIALTGISRRFESHAEQLNHYYEVFAFRVGEPEERKVAVLFNDINERKQAQQALQSALEQAEKGRLLLEAVLENIPEGISITGGPPDFPLERISRYGLELTRNPENAGLLGKPAGEHQVAWGIYLEDGETIPSKEQMPLYRASHFGETVRNVEMVIRLQNGERVSVLVNAAPIRNDQGHITGAINSWRDITERKQVEEALRKSEEKFAKAFRSSPVAIAISTISDGRFIEANDSYTALFGFSREELIGHTSIGLGMFPNPEDRKEVRRRIEEKGSFRNYELRLLTKSGEPRDVYFSTERIEIDGQDCMLSLVIDITERKQVEAALGKYTEELRASEERFRQLANAMPQLVWTARSDGTIDYLNERYLEYEGFTFIEGRGWDWSNAVHPEDLPGLFARWNQVVLTEDFQQYEFRMLMADGTYRWHLARSIPIRDQTGEVIRWIGTNTDIEDQKQIEEKLRRSNQELEQFAFIASHDLQEPLRKIILFGNNLRNLLGDTSDETADDYLHRMESAAERMQEMINGLLELSRVNSNGGNFIPINLNRLMKEVVSDLEGRIHATNGQVQIYNLPAVAADEQQMRRLFQNLIVNAIKFHRPDVPPVVKISGKIDQTKQPQMVEIRVEDNGIGFEQEFAERIFQPFQRLHGRAQYEGTGLGLAICKKIVERHQGTIEVQSVAGEGTTFTVLLPAKPAIIE